MTKIRSTLAACPPGGAILRNEIRMLARIQHPGVPENLQPLPRRVVHEEEVHAIIHREAADADHLAVAAVVSEHEFVRAGDFAGSPSLRRDAGDTASHFP
jgi:hypothetical protein